MIWGPTPIFGNIHVFSTTIKALISIEASALSLGAAAEPKGHSSQGSAPSPRRLVGGLSWFLPMLAMKFANQPYLTQQKLGQLAHCCWISCWISRMLHPFTSTISRSPPVPFTLSAPASVALPLPVPLVPWHGSPVRKEISYGFGSLFRSLWQQLCYFTTIQLYIYIPIHPDKFWVSFCLDILSATNAHQLHPSPETPRPAHHSKLKLCPASKPKQLGLVISDLLSGKLT